MSNPLEIVILLQCVSGLWTNRTLLGRKISLLSQFSVLASKNNYILDADKKIPINNHLTYFA